jgi:hypothetical protein
MCQVFITSLCRHPGCQHQHGPIMRRVIFGSILLFAPPVPTNSQTRSD